MIRKFCSGKFTILGCPNVNFPETETTFPKRQVDSARAVARNVCGCATFRFDSEIYQVA